MINRPAVELTRSSAVAEASQPIILGSASPRRAALLAALGVDFVVETVDIDEQVLAEPGLDAADAVVRIARAKFHAFGPPFEAHLPTLLTADTLVAYLGHDGAMTTMGKPASATHLRQLLVQMSGQSLTIATAVCVGDRGAEPETQVVITTVQLRELSSREIDEYIATGAGKDKAAGLALQAEANSFIESVDGCWSNVLGLPVCAVAAALDQPASSRSRDAWCSTELCGNHKG